MYWSFSRQGRCWSWLFSLALPALVAGPLYGQLLPFCRPRAKTCEPVPLEPCPAPEERKPTPEPAPTPTPTPTLEPSPLLPDTLASAVGGEAVALAAPNMIGNLLNGSRSVSFVINRVAGSTFVFDLGSTSIVNPKVADDNSPLPADRLGFRYNHFDRAVSVTGISAQPPVFDPSIIGFRQTTATRFYDVDQYTFIGEKTFFDRLMSLEIRVPFSTGLASKLNLQYGTITGVGPGVPIPQNLIPDVPFSAQPFPGQGFNVVSTPDQTLGQKDTEWGNMTLILKSLLYESPRLAFSGGAALGIPTGQDTHVKVIDFLGDALFFSADTVRQRDFHIQNESWSLSPFLAFLATPGPKFFTQGFMQFDFPLNGNHVQYTETIPLQIPPGQRPISTIGQRFGPPVTIRPGVPVGVPLVVDLTAPFTVRERVDEQILMHVDLGTGYWLRRDANDRWITGIAPTLELHYTTALENADIVRLPNDNSFISLPGVFKAVPPPPTVGNTRNRVDILDLTAGSTFLLGDRTTLALGVAVPLRNGDDRTYDWELQFQLNHYFGGPSRLR